MWGVGKRDAMSSATAANWTNWPVSGAGVPADHVAVARAAGVGLLEAGGPRTALEAAEPAAVLRVAVLRGVADEAACVLAPDAARADVEQAGSLRNTAALLHCGGVERGARGGCDGRQDEERQCGGEGEREAAEWS